MMNPSITEPLISIVVIFLNAERFLSDAVESVFVQNYSNWELLLVDDGSTDGSAEVARKYAAEDSNRVRYLTHPGRANMGMSASRNLGLANARGEFVALLDADDTWVADKLKEQVAIFMAHPEADMLYGPASYWHPNEPHRDFIQNVGVSRDTVFSPRSLALAFLADSNATPPTGTLLIRRDFARGIGGFVDDFRGMFEDQAFCFKAALQGTIVVSPRCWLRYRQHAESCCGVAFAERGSHAAARRRFLDWYAQYLDDNAIDDAKLWATLTAQRQTFSVSRQFWQRSRRVVGRLLPPAVRMRLRLKPL